MLCTRMSFFYIYIWSNNSTIVSGFTFDFCQRRNNETFACEVGRGLERTLHLFKLEFRMRVKGNISAPVFHLSVAMARQNHQSHKTILSLLQLVKIFNMTRKPSLGVSYPLKIGSTLRAQSTSTNESRKFLALKFPHIPDGTQTNMWGQMTLNDDKFTVNLPATDDTSTSTQVFSGPRKPHVAKSHMSEYLLIFHDGNFWLEQLADYAHFLRHDGTIGEAIETNEHAQNDIAADPDSWMMTGQDLSGSSITAEKYDGGNNNLTDEPGGSMHHIPRRDFSGEDVLGSVQNSTVVSTDCIDDSKFADHLNAVAQNNQLNILLPKTTIMKSITTVASPAVVELGGADIIKETTEDIKIVDELVEVDEELANETEDDHQSIKSSTSNNGHSDDSNSGSDSNSDSNSDSGSDSDSDSNSIPAVLTDSSSDEGMKD